MQLREFLSVPRSDTISENAAVRDQPLQYAFVSLALLLPWSALLQAPHPINVDASWFFYVARGVLQGGTLYRDYIEPNAPLASLSLLPAVLLARALAITPDMAVEVVVLAYAAVSLALCVMVLQRMRLGRKTMLQTIVILGFAFVFLPKAFFGQREHILAMLLTPYVLGSAAVCAGCRLPRGLGCGIGMVAAVAVGLKPPFVLVPAILEMVVVARTGMWATVRAQAVALGATLVATTVATLVFFPLYAAQIVPWAAALYSGYNQPELLLQNLAYAAVACGLVWFGWATRADGWRAAFRLCLTAAFIGALGAFAAQGKGWMYQVCPAWLFLFVMTACAIVSSGLRPGASVLDAARWFAPRLVAAVFGLFLVFGAWSSADMSKFAAMSATVAGERGPFLILTSNVLPAFPMALHEDRVWASRMPCLIMLPGLLKAEQRGEVSPWEGVFRGWIDADLLRYRPAVVFIPPNGPEATPPGFDVLAWLLRDPKFAAIWSHYRQDGTRDTFRLFRLI